MTFVVTETCIKCKLTDCVEVCPVECIPNDPDNEETEEQLWEKYRRLISRAAI